MWDPGSADGRLESRELGCDDGADDTDEDRLNGRRDRGLEAEPAQVLLGREGRAPRAAGRPSAGRRRWTPRLPPASALLQARRLEGRARLAEGSRSRARPWSGTARRTLRTLPVRGKLEGNSPPTAQETCRSMAGILMLVAVECHDAFPVPPLSSCGAARSPRDGARPRNSTPTCPSRACSRVPRRRRRGRATRRAAAR